MKIKIKNGLFAIAFILYITLMGSCRKEFLEKIPNKALLVPNTLDDFQAILDNTQIMNTAPSIAFISADDFTISESGYGSLVTSIERNCYIWLANQDLYEGRSINDWNTPFIQVFYANIVLEGLDNLPEKIGSDKYDGIKGTAFFMRAFANYQLSLLFASQYNATTSNTNLGVPIRLSSNVNIKSERGTLESSYQQIISDLLEATKYLPQKTNYKSRPNKAAANLLLSKIYLAMGKYDLAEIYASNAISTAEGLIDYNSLNPSSNRPFPVALPNANSEVLFYSSMITYGFLSSAQTSVDLSLYQSYASNDIRKEAFFRDRGNNMFQFKGNYTGNPNQFAGLSTNEAFLIKAECQARKGDYLSAMNTLNSLLIKRWKTNTFVSFKAIDAQQALSLILQERRKELVGRETRWFDLRRLNMDPLYAKTISRMVGSKSFSLPPNDVRYTLPIPLNEVNLSDIPQNNR